LLQSFFCAVQPADDEIKIGLRVASRFDFFWNARRIYALASYPDTA
jgi:hypothetical protein